MSPGEYAKTKAARYYIYGQARVSKMTFDDKEFRELLISYYVAGGGNREKCPFLRWRELADYVRGEFKCFCLLMTEFAKRQMEYSLGNPWCQLIHDGATLANHVKTLATGIECVDMLLQENHCVCLGMDPLSDGTDATNATLLREVFRRAGLGEVEHAAHSSVEDRAARYVADLFEHDPECVQRRDIDSHPPR